MTMTGQTLLDRMATLTSDWGTTGDNRRVFLNCYLIMTGSMLAGIDRRDFDDNSWMRDFVDHFAGYYFIALDAYDDDPQSAPPVWRAAHDAALDEKTWPIQQLLLGVNAHINYDLVLTIDDLLHTDWSGLSPLQQAARRADYDRVNDIIGQTVDAVQETVLNPAMPIMDWIDRLLGRTDEWLLSALLSGWRDEVWDHATHLLVADQPDERTAVIQTVEAAALRRAQAIRLADWRALDELL